MTIEQAQPTTDRSLQREPLARATRAFAVPARVSTALLELTGRQNAALLDLAAATVLIVLSRYTGTADPAVAAAPPRAAPPVSPRARVAGGEPVDAFPRAVPGAARSPRSVAVVFAGGSVTRADRDGRATRLARFLIARGAGPGGVVALLLARGVDLVVAQLGVAKTGAAFLPVDPAYPPARVAF